MDPQGSSVPRHKRTKRACDRCSFSRTRCNGCSPCNRCVEYDHACTYTREVKRRGRKHKQYQGALAQFAHSSDVGIPETIVQGGISIDAISPSTSQHSRDESSLDFSGGPVGSALSRTDHGQRAALHSNGNVMQDSLLSSVLPDSFSTAGAVSDFIPREILRRRTSPIISSHYIASSDHQTRLRTASVSNLTSSPTNPELQSCEVTANTPHSQWTEKVQSPLQHTLNHHSYSESPRSEIRETLPIENSTHCRYPILVPLIPVLGKIIPMTVACELLELYFDQPGCSLLKFTSPYVLTHILRRRSILHPSCPRVTGHALLLAMLHATAHTADIALFYVPGSRSKICDALYTAVVHHLHDPDDWHRSLSGRWDRLDASNEAERVRRRTQSMNDTDMTFTGPMAGTDELLTLILLTIVVSGGTFKSDCLRWWRKSILLARVLKLNQLDDKRHDTDRLSFAETEAMEEQRRLFWLIFCLDRHLALSYNAPLSIFDADTSVFLPLAENLWEDLDLHFSSLRNQNLYGPSTVVSGTGFFEFFLPLMTILGDIVILHHRRLHPRFGTVGDADDIVVVEELLEKCQQSVKELQDQGSVADGETPQGASVAGSDLDDPDHRERTTHSARVRLVAAYSTHILHVLAVLLYGKWDPLDMLSTSPTSSSKDNASTDSDDWITPARFIKCASHAVSGSQAVAAIIDLDPELAFMPYLFGIYLLHGSFILLLFADRMPQLGGPNPEVEAACETIVRAHEICIVTLSTEFQRSFRRILRSTLYAVKSLEPNAIDDSQARTKALEMYRWTRGGRGLAL